MKLSWGRMVRGLGAATLLYGWAETWRVQVREYEVVLPNLPPDAEGMRLLQVTDLHFGLYMPRALLRRIIALIAAQGADAIVFTGDVVSRRSSYFPVGVRPHARPVTEYAAILAEELATLRAPFGVWTVPGNHDMWRESFDSIADILAGAGVVPLVNRAVRLKNGLALLGFDDLRAGHPDVARTLAGVPEDEGQVILSHNPRLALLLRRRAALILSGHTHAGQIKIPGLPARSSADTEQTFWQSGWFQVGRAQLYVGAGAGTVGIPIRLNVPPEIAIFTLRRAPRG